MAKQDPDQQYTPRGERIPIPKRGDFESNLDRLLKAPPPPPRFRKKRSGERPTSSREQ